MKWLRDETGQALIITVLCMAVLLGALGLAIDAAVLFRAKRNMQTAADAAAMAGAVEMFYNGSTNVASKAYAAAKANGVDNTVSGNTVIVNTSPTLNPGGVSCPSCVQVRLATPNPTVFMAAVGGPKSVNVAAMGVAGSPGYSHTCMYVMDPSNPDTLDIHGAGSINAPGCDVYVNSDSPAALCVTGSAGKSDLSPGGAIVVHGNQDSKGNCKGTPGPPTQFGAGVQSSPYATTLPLHPESNCTSTTDLSSLTGTVTGPGYGGYACYSNGSCTTTTTKGVTTTTCNPVTLSSATLGPGTYVFTTGVTITGATKIGQGTGNKTDANGGATVIVTNGTYDSGTATTFYDYAPADPNATYNGVAIYQVETDKNPMTLQFGSGSSVFMGAVYAPGAQVTLHDQGGAVNATQLVVGSIYLNGKLNLANYSAYNQNTTPFKHISLVE
jgi:hypothetical protein